MRGVMPYAWNDDYPARVGVMPRGGSDADVRWIEVSPCYVFHPMNAYDDGVGRVVVDTARYDSLWRDTTARFEPARLHRWILDPRNGSVVETALDDLTIEFPRIDERRTGSAHRYGYAVKNPGGGVNQPATALVKYDLETGRTEAHDFGPGRVPSEGVFAPASAQAGEDEGWVMTYVFDQRENTSDFVVLDATRIGAPPVAEVRLPQRVPFGFHGSWLAAY
jgi:carotenoid cleavage dioxygenase